MVFVLQLCGYAVVHVVQVLQVMQVMQVVKAVSDMHDWHDLHDSSILIPVSCTLFSPA
ncbi:MAG: hypothetical protein H6Q24_304 [Bacteroidetes bacterium]|nr:hypothetical protein [Bacteroidota bacterium]